MSLISDVIRMELEAKKIALDNDIDLLQGQIADISAKRENARVPDEEEQIYNSLEESGLLAEIRATDSLIRAKAFYLEYLKNPHRDLGYASFINDTYNELKTALT